MVLPSTDEVPVLFEKMTVQEVQEYERKTRAEIEKRKEDLRVMVGERYRDLIEAADTIRDMKSSVESVSQHVKRMYDFNAAINQRKKVPRELNRVQSSPTVHQQCYSIAAQVKLLLDIPDKIWLNLENDNHLNAANLYILAQHVHTSLELEMHNKSAVPISTCFPIVEHQWATILHFRSSILQKCQEAMKAMGSSDQQMADCVGAILCITDCTPRKLCSDFLSIRMASLEDIFNPNNHVSNVKDQIAALIKLIKETVCLTCSLFHRGRNANRTYNGSLLTEVLETVTNAKKDDFLSLAVSDKTPWAEYLPQSFSDFCPTLQAAENALSDDFLLETFSHWIKVAKDTVTSGVTQILSYVNSVKGLATIQEAVQEILQEINHDDGWTNACRCLISKEINFWEEFLSSLFVFRIKTVVHSQVHGILKLSQQNIKLAMDELKTDGPKELDRDVSGFIWLEETGDLPAKFVWGSAKGDGNVFGNLTLKAKGFTPRVQSVCNVMDNRLKAVLEDVECYAKSSQAFAQKLSVNMSLDLTHIQSDVQSACDNLIIGLLEFVKDALSSTSEGYVSTHVTVTRALMLARLCAAFGELCPHLKKGIAGGINSSMKELFKDPHSSGKAFLKYGEDPLWQNIMSKLSEEKLRLYGFWKSDLCRKIKEKTKNLVPVNVADIFKHMPQWDLIEIDEENEHGVTVKSTISVPMQASWQMQHMMYWICRQINMDGGHVIPRPVLQELRFALLTMGLTTYEEYLKNIHEKKQFASQSASLQLLFDIRFLTGLIVSKENKELGDRIQAICTDFESHVDPFDLDVFLPYINNHLKRSIQRSVVLLSSLTSTDRTGIFGTNRPTYLSQQEQHNVLSLSLGSRIRFTLLPVGTSANKNTSDKKAGFQPQPTDTKPSVASKPDKSRSISPQRSTVVQSTGVHKSASSSFFGAMSSSWFGN